MALTLAVDTTADWGSIALADENGTREEVLLEAPRGFSHVLFDAIHQLLERNGVALGDMGLFAGASGPGSFTGVRVGLSAIKALAETLGKPAAAVSSLAALADLGEEPVRAVLIDAHRGEVFAAVYDANGTVVLDESVLSLAAFVEKLGGRRVEWISQDESILAQSPPGALVRRAPRAIAGVIARVAMRSPSGDPAAIEANYVRRSDAEIFWKEV